jgi:hypothetical protein
MARKISTCLACGKTGHAAVKLDPDPSLLNGAYICPAPGTSWGDTVKDAVFRVMVAFTKRGPDARDEFIDGLTDQQYAALRELNVLRIDSGDARIPEDYLLDSDGTPVEQ